LTGIISEAEWGKERIAHPGANMEVLRIVVKKGCLTCPKVVRLPSIPSDLAGSGTDYVNTAAKPMPKLW